MADNDRNDDVGAQPVAAPASATRWMVIILAALVVAALLGWFLLGNNRAPGPAATETSKSQTEQSFEDTVIVNPDGSVKQQVPSDADTLSPGGQAIPAPTITDNQGSPTVGVGPATVTPPPSATQ
ncbi:MAG TPA: hypothetical protein VF138_11855 [Caulobacteraceae bacterium]